MCLAWYFLGLAVSLKEQMAGVDGPSICLTSELRTGDKKKRLPNQVKSKRTKSTHLISRNTLKRTLGLFQARIPFLSLVVSQLSSPHHSPFVVNHACAAGEAALVLPPASSIPPITLLPPGK